MQARRPHNSTDERYKVTLEAVVWCNYVFYLICILQMCKSAAFSGFLLLSVCLSVSLLQHIR